MKIDKDQIRFVELKLIMRTRKSLTFKTPFECFHRTTVALIT